jgi:hypothetical protein
MPVSPHLLQAAAANAFGGYALNRAQAVRGGNFIATFEQYSEQELRLLGLPPLPIVSNNRVRQTFDFSQTSYILGGHYVKNVDVTLQSSSSGPLLSISLKSMLSSIEKNVNNRWEEAIGDAANLHARFPMLVLGFLVILPTVAIATPGGRVEEIIDQATGQPTALADAIVRKLSAARGRRTPTDLPSYYEEIGIAVFDPTPPFALHPTFPDPASNLRIDYFFDRLADRFRERNPHLL